MNYAIDTADFGMQQRISFASYWLFYCHHYICKEDFLFLPASCWEYAAKHYVKISRFIPTKKTRPSTPGRLMGAGDLDLSVRFLFTFGDFLAVRIPEPDKIWKFDVRL